MSSHYNSVDILRKKVSLYISIASFLFLIIFMFIDILTENTVSQTIYILLSSILGGGLGITTLQQYTDASIRHREKAVRKKEGYVKEYEESIKSKSDLVERIDKIVDSKLKAFEK